MKIFEKATLNEIVPVSKKTSGTDWVLSFYLKDKTITDKVFNKSGNRVARGTINLKNLAGVTFRNCEFNYINFFDAEYCYFIDCSFKSCRFTNLSDTLIKDCNFEGNSYLTDDSIISGNCAFINCHGLEFNGELESDSVEASNCPEYDEFSKYLESKRLEKQRYLESQANLRKNLKYGYKVVKVPVLIKLSFPEDAIVYNLDKSKHRANKAKVESIHIIKDFEGEGVTNYPGMNYSKKPLDYKVGEVVYPDSFDEKLSECGHGIHFCTNVNSLANYGDIHCTCGLNPYIKLFNEISNENV